MRVEATGELCPLLLLPVLGSLLLPPHAADGWDGSRYLTVPERE